MHKTGAKPRARLNGRLAPDVWRFASPASRVAFARGLRDTSRVRPGRRLYLVWLPVYLLLVVWITWPLARHSTTHLPAVRAACRFDGPLIAWALAHQTESLASSPCDLPHPGVFHPDRYGLFYGEAAFGAVPIFAPVYLCFSKACR